MNNVTRVLPPGEERELECDRLAELIRKAIIRTLHDLKNLSPPYPELGVCRPEGESCVHYKIQSPGYREKEVREHIHKIWRSEETIALIDYIWDHGALKETITGPEPNKESWAKFKFDKLVHHPLLVALETTQRERLIDLGKIEAWEVDEDKVEKVIQEAVDFYCRKKQLVTAICPLAWLNLPSGTSIELASDIRLRGMTTRDVCLLLSRHKHEYHWEDFKQPAIVRDVAEICFPIETGKKHNVHGLIQDRLDLLKWGLFVAFDMNEPVAEGTCVIKGMLDARLGIFRRDENMGSLYKIDEKRMQKCKEIIQNFRNFSKDQLKSALWHFGRACAANQPRDILFESAIGLDLLLVPGSGESRYRFCLHGAAILAENKDEGEIIYKELDEIFKNRSQAAHGQKVNKNKELALKARKILAKVIFKVINLMMNNKIDRSRNIGVGVQKFVLEKATTVN